MPRDREVRVGLVGAGQWGPNLLRCLDAPPFSCVPVVVDRDRARLDQIAARFPRVAVSDRIDAVFDAPDIEAIVIATPTSTHYDFVRAALDAGKDVLVEKPIATRLDQALELAALAESRGRILMVGHVFLFNPAVRRVRQYLDDGELGRTYYISMVRTNLGPIRVDVNAAWDLIAHDVSIANYWLGAEPDAASAVGGSWINAGIEDCVFATLRYGGGTLVNVHASWLNPRKARQITVVGSKRMLVFDDMDLVEPVRIYDKRIGDEASTPSVIDSFASFRASVRDGDVRIPRVAAGEPLKAECDHFLDCVRHRTRPLVGGAEGAAVVRVLEAIQRSVEARGQEQPV